MKKESKLENLKIPEEILPDLLGGHYGKTIYSHSNGYVTVTGSITGCGLAQMYGVVSLKDDEESKKVIEQIKNEYITGYGAGGILATLGQSWKGHEKIILSLGFKKIAEYPNYHHDRSGKEIQSLYILNK